MTRSHASLTPFRPRSRRLLVALAACALFAPLARADTRGFVFTTDYSTGSLSEVNLATRAVAQDVAGGVCSDARLRWYQGRLYVLDRLNCDNVLVLDPSQGYAVVKQFSTGNGSNPADIVFVSPTKAYVPCYERSDLLIVNPAAGTITGHVSLAAFADADGIPEMDHAIRIGDRVFVALQRLARPSFTPTDSSLVVVIDDLTDTVVDADPVAAGVQGIRLTAKNPSTAFAYDPSSHRLAVGCSGAFGALDGGIEWVDPAALASAGVAVTEAVLGGNVNDFAWNGSAHSYAIVSDPGPPFETRLVAFDADHGTRLGTLLAPGGFVLGDCEVNDRGELYVCDGDFSGPGLLVYSTATDGLLAGPLDTGLPPNQITFDHESNAVLAVGGEPSRPAFDLVAAPNPARMGARIRMALAHQARLRLDVLDLAGRNVRTLVDETRPRVSLEATWDLRDSRGQLVRPGIYLLRARLHDESVRKSDERVFTRRISVLR